MRSQPGGHRLRLEAPAPAVALVDPARVDQIVRNLIANALAYAPNGPVLVRVVGESDAVRIDVADRGPGIPRDQRERVFEPFYRGPAAERNETPGSGLGLSLVKQIAERHGGRVRCEARDGGGSCFVLALPQRA